MGPQSSPQQPDSRLVQRLATALLWVVSHAAAASTALVLRALFGFSQVETVFFGMWFLFTAVGAFVLFLPRTSDLVVRLLEALRGGQHRGP